jgi:N-acetylglucosamine-6-phosphate deacetylase
MCVGDINMNPSIQAYNTSFTSKISTIPSLKQLNSHQVHLRDVKLNGYTAFIGGDVFTPSNKIVKQNLLFNDKRLIATDEFDENKIKDSVQYVLLNDETITPAILDEHIHGGYGVNFHNSSETQIRLLLRKLKETGTGAVIATTLPGSTENIKKQIKLLSSIIKNPNEGEAKIYGIHLEGPFLSPHKSGIHHPEILQEPTIENYLALEPENVKIVTLAPEEKGGIELAKYLNSNGVIASAGHTMALASDIVKSGIKQVTHIFNAMAPFRHRELTVANEAIFNDEIAAEMNSDKSLLDPKIMDFVMRMKPKDKLILISDALPEAGIKKDFIMNNVLIHVKDDWTAISDDGKTLAGSMQFLHDLAKQLIDTTQMKFQDFIRYASVNPSKNLKVEKDFRIEKGFSPNFTVWNNKTIKPEKTFTI